MAHNIHSLKELVDEIGGGDPNKALNRLQQAKQVNNVVSRTGLTVDKFIYLFNMFNDPLEDSPPPPAAAPQTYAQRTATSSPPAAPPITSTHVAAFIFYATHATLSPCIALKVAGAQDFRLSIMQQKVTNHAPKVNYPRHMPHALAPYTSRLALKPKFSSSTPRHGRCMAPFRRSCPKMDVPF